MIEAVRKYRFERTKRPCRVVPATDIDQQPIVISLRRREAARCWPSSTSVRFPRGGENTMGRTLTVASIALVAASLAFWGAIAILRAENPNWTEQMSEALRKAGE